MTTQGALTCNGIDIGAVEELIGAMHAQPEAGRVVIRTRHRWDDGAGVDGATEEIDFFGGIIERTHVFRADFPRELGGEDTGPVPGEYLLAALGACVAGSYVEEAARRGIRIDELEIGIEAELDLRGSYGLAPVPVGLSGVTLDVRVHADAEDAVLEELGRAALRRSPAADSLARPVPLELAVRRRA